MIYKVGDTVIAKKPHACGGNKWEITRIGADVKVKCVQCGRSMFLSVDQVEKMTKTYIPVGEKNG